MSDKVIFAGTSFGCLRWVISPNTMGNTSLLKKPSSLPKARLS